MERRDKRAKVKSDYTLLKNKHKQLLDGTIYENDYMTISKMDELFTSDQIPVYSDSNFKFSTREAPNVQRKHSRGKFEECVLSGSGLYTKTDENRIRLKPDYEWLKDFAYYGSAVELVKASINDIIIRFPAEMYFTPKTQIYEDGETYYQISNDFLIDIDSITVSPNLIGNELRYFFKSYEKYSLINGGEETPLIDIDPYNTWSVERLSPSCVDLQGQTGAWVAIVTICGMKIYVREINGIKYLYYKDSSYIGYRIRPQSKYIEEFFDSLDDFEKVILNRDTYPIYRADFNTPYETENGFFYTKEMYIWPSVYEYNPDISSLAYESYLRNLINLATYHDDYDSDNIWRSLTHEAIKNLDWTFLRKNGENSEEIDTIDSTRIEAICRLYGRLYDDLKRSADNIKRCNNVSYNGRGNAPDYTLSDDVDNMGFEAKDLNITCDNSILTGRLYKCENRGHNSSDANIEFYRRLKLNARYLTSIKGTRKGVETMLSLFGFTPDDYTIKEYTSVAVGKKNYDRFCDEEKKINVSYPLLCDIEEINTNKDSYIVDESNGKVEDKLAGIPLNAVYLTNENGEEQAYVVPWYHQGKEYDGNLYFQMMGGWSKVITKKINLDIAPNVTEITSSNLLSLYEETQTSIRYVNTLSDLVSLNQEEIREGDVCYVTNLNDILKTYNFKDDTEKEAFSGGAYSHYFILENGDLPSWLGFYSGNTATNTYGWKNVFESEFNTTNENVTESGKKVLYLETLTDKMTGNNPHVGHARYDDGKEYLDYMSKPFKWSLENNNLTSFDDSNCDKINKYVFELSENLDERKCWYFTDYNNINENLLVNKGGMSKARSDYENFFRKRRSAFTNEFTIEYALPEGNEEVFDETFSEVFGF